MSAVDTRGRSPDWPVGYPLPVLIGSAALAVAVLWYTQQGVLPAGWSVWWALLLLVIGAGGSVRPSVGLAALLVMTYGVSSHGDTFDRLLSTPLLDGAAVLLAVAAWRHRHHEIRSFTVACAAGLTLAIATALVVAVVDRGAPVGAFLRHRPGLWMQGMLVFAVSCFSMRDRTDHLIVSVTTCVCVLARAWMQSDGIRLESYLATLAILSAPLALVVVVLVASRPLQVAMSLTFTALLAIAIGSANRAAAVGLVAMAVALVWAVRAALLNSASRAAVAAAVLSAVVAAAALGGPGLRFRALLDPAASHTTAALDRATAASRIDLWTAAWEMARLHPWAGVGPGNFPIYLPMVQPGAEAGAARNSILHTLAETGWPGALSWLALFGCALLSAGAGRPTWPLGDDRRAAVRGLVFASLAAYLAGGMFNSRHDLLLAYVLAGWSAALAAPGSRRRIR